MSTRAKRLVGSAGITAVVMGLFAFLATHLWLVPWALAVFATVVITGLVYALWGLFTDETDDGAW